MRGRQAKDGRGRTLLRPGAGLEEEEKNDAIMGRNVAFGEDLEDVRNEFYAGNRLVAVRAW